MTLNDAVNDYDVLGLNPFFSAMAKCANKILLQKIKEKIDEKMMVLGVCGSLKKQIINDGLENSDQWCKGSSVSHTDDFKIDEKSAANAVASCVTGFFAGKAKDKIFKGIDDDVLKELLKKIVDMSADEVTKHIGGIDRDPVVKCKCSSKKGMNCTLSMKFSTKIDGIKNPLGEDILKDDISCSGSFSKFICCQCP